ncbi:MAG: rhamnulokinase [Clostridia bacterium]|nr:rhamnulokinase [Clostridia bacterium]
MYYLSIDIGASSGRHILGHFENGRITLKEIYRFENGAEKKDGKMIWNVEKLFKNIVEGLKECKNLGVIPYSVGIDTWGVDYALLDKDGNLIDEVFSYRDSRTQDVMEKVEQIIPFKELYSITGIQRAPYNTIYQLYCDKLSGKLEKAEKMISVVDYLHYLLSGIPLNEYTHASTTGMLDAKTRTWSTEIIERLGFPKKLFGSLTAPGTIVGKVKKEIANEIGYETLVCLPASHDTASAVVAVPSDSETPLYISSGTWSLLGTELKEPVTSETAYKFNATNEGGYGNTIRFLKNITGMWTFQNIKKELNNKYSYDELMNMAKLEDVGSVVDLNDNAFLAPDSMIEAVKDYCRKNGLNVPTSIGQVMDVVYKSLATTYASVIKETEEVTGQTFDVLNIVGGGSKDAYLNELTKKYTKKRVMVGPTEGTAVGNLLCQAMASKEIANVKEARQVVRNSLKVVEI